MATDRGLTDLGRAQAARLRDRLAATGEMAADALVASTLPRAHETAQIIAPALGLEPVPDDDVHELRCGEGEGLPYDEFEARYGPYHGRSATEPADPGGECWTQFCQRVTRALTRITEEHAGRGVTVVCHGGVIDAFTALMWGTPHDRLPGVRLHTANTSISEWLSVDGEWVLIRYNDHAHLTGLPSGDPVRWPAVRVGALAGD